MRNARVRRDFTRGFTLIEVLVALVIIGVAGAGLVAALSNDRHMRDLAAGETFAGERTRERIETLAATPCAASAAGASESTWGSERWVATASGVFWQLTDSLMPARSAARIVVEARVACPE